MLYSFYIINYYVVDDYFFFFISKLIMLSINAINYLIYAQFKFYCIQNLS